MLALYYLNIHCAIGELGRFAVNIRSELEIEMYTLKWECQKKMYSIIDYYVWCVVLSTRSVIVTRGRDTTPRARKWCRMTQPRRFFCDVITCQPCARRDIGCVFFLCLVLPCPVLYCCVLPCLSFLALHCLVLSYLRRFPAVLDFLPFCTLVSSIWKISRSSVAMLKMSFRHEYHVEGVTGNPSFFWKPKGHTHRNEDDQGEG